MTAYRVDRLVILLVMAALTTTILVDSAAAQSAKSAKERFGGSKNAAAGTPALSPRDAALQEKSAKGDPEAMYQWALLVEQGATGKPDLEGAAQILKTAAEKGHKPAMVAWGNALFYGRGVAKDPKQAAAWYRKAADAGDPVGLHNVGVVYERGIGVARDVEEAKKWYTKADKAGFKPAEQSVERLTRSAELAEKRAKDLDGLALDELQRRAEKGDGAAAYELSMRLENGRGVKKDDAKALDWLKKAADKDDADALVTLAARFMNGAGVPKDEKRVVALWKRGADKNFAASLANYAWAHREGYGSVKKDLQKALDLYVQAADLGDPVAMFNLGMFYLRGWIVPPDESTTDVAQEIADFARGVKKKVALKVDVEHGKKDFAAATNWFRKGAELGDLDCINAMGIAYETGEGAPLNADVASDWYTTARASSKEAEANARRLALRDGFSAYATFFEAMTIKDNPDKARLFAIHAADCFYGEGGTPHDVREAVASLAMAFKQQTDCREIAVISSELFDYFYQRAEYEPAAMCLDAEVQKNDAFALMNAGLLASRTDPKKADALYKKAEALAARAGDQVKRGTIHLRWRDRQGPFIRKPRPAETEAEAPVKLGKPLEETTHLADKGDAEACYQLGLYLMQEKDAKQALVRMTAAAAKGYSKAYYTLGLWNSGGRGVPQDRKTAIDWYDKAVEAGESDAFPALAALLEQRRRDRIALPGSEDGDGVADLRRIADVLTVGALKGNVLAMRMLGNFYQQNGLSIERDLEKGAKTVFNAQGAQDEYKKAVEEYRKAAERDDVDSMRQLAWHLESGRGVEKNESEAVRWSRAAAATGDPLAVIEFVQRLFRQNSPGADAEAVEKLKKALEKDPEFDEAAGQLAWATENGRGVDRNVEEAFRTYRRLALRGHEPSRADLYRLNPAMAKVAEARRNLFKDGAAELELARAYGRGEGVVHEPALAAAFARFSQLRGSLDGAALAAELRARGIGMYSIPSMALKDIQPGLDKKHPRSMGALGEMLVSAHGFPIDDERGFNLLMRAAEAGDLRAMHLLGHACRGGVGTPASGALAADWWRKGAAKDDVESMLSLGGAFEEGFGTPLDEPAATRWYFRAWVLRDGRGYDKFSLLAAKLFKIPAPSNMGPLGGAPQPARFDFNDTFTAAQKDFPDPMLKIGRMYLEGIGYERDPAKAFEWIEKAAKKEHPPAMFELARMYRTGDGAKKDDNFAGYWETRAKDAQQRQRVRTPGM